MTKRKFKFKNEGHIKASTPWLAENMIDHKETKSGKVHNRQSKRQYFATNFGLNKDKRYLGISKPCKTQNQNI